MASFSKSFATKRRDALDRFRVITDSILEALSPAEKAEFESHRQNIIDDERITGRSLLSISMLLRIAFEAGKRSDAKSDRLPKDQSLSE